MQADVLHNSPGKLYLHVAEVMRSRVKSGVWEPGERLKPLAQMAKEFGVANVTVRQAVEILEREGKLRRRQGSGTFVTDCPISAETFSVGLSWPQLLDMVTKTEPHLVSKTPDAKLPKAASDMGQPARSYTHLRRMNTLKGQKCLVTDAYIDDRIYNRSPDDFDTKTIIPLIEAMHGTHIDRCRQILTIGQATPDIAALLNVPVNYPMGDIRRVITDPDGVIIYWNDVSYRGDLVRFEIDLDLESGGTSTPPSPNAGAAMIC